MGAKERKAAHGAAVKIRDLPHVAPEELVLVTDKKNRLYDARVLDEPSEEMILNIMFYGPIEPVIVVKNTETGKYEVADGRTRVKATREANKRIKKRGGEPWPMPFIVKRVDDGTAVGLMVSLNEQRRADTALNRARKAAQMIEHGKTEEEVGVAFGLSVASVKNLIALLDAPAVVRHAVEAGKISTTDGYKLAKLEPAEAKAKVEKLVTEAPRTPGKKRSANAKKAREIVDGPKRPSVASFSPGGENGVAEDGVRAQHIIENVLAELEEKIKAAKKAGEREDEFVFFGAVDALKWVLGDDEALDGWLNGKTSNVDVKRLYGNGEAPTGAKAAP